MSINESEIFVECVEMPPYEQLEREWLDLEIRSDVSFFTSWAWIGCWLACLPEIIKPKLLRATKGNVVVGLGVLVFRDFWRHRIIPVKGLFLNATGDSILDDIIIEYNGFIVDNTLFPEVITRIYKHIFGDSLDWDELHLEGVTEITGCHLCSSADLQVVKRQECINFVDLKGVRESDGDYLALLGYSTRYNIRRSIKEFAKIGSVRLNVAGDVDEALEYLSILKGLHQAYWQSKGLPGSFANSFFEAFHDRLIRSRFDKGEVQLIRVCAGDRAIGCLYNFIHNRTVHNYQTGFDYSLCKRQYSPGLVTHSLAIEYNLSQGYNIYDLMAGDSQYKQALGTKTCNLEWLVIKKVRLKYKLEEALRLLKYRFAGHKLKKGE